MHTLFVPICLLGLVATITASVHSPGSGIHAHATLSKRDCELRTVYFHWNNSLLGSMPSCSWDVLSVASRPIGSSSSTRSLDARQQGSCTDGPTTNYTVKSGDTLERIAAQFNSGVCNIAVASGIAKNPDFLAIGQALTVPTHVCKPDNESCRKPPGTRPCVPKAENPPKSVEIAAGDTFTLLGSKFNVTADAFVGKNLCLDPSLLQIGQKVKVPICPHCNATY